MPNDQGCLLYKFAAVLIIIVMVQGNFKRAQGGAPQVTVSQQRQTLAETLSWETTKAVEAYYTCGRNQ